MLDPCASEKYELKMNGTFVGFRRGLNFIFFLSVEYTAYRDQLTLQSSVNRYWVPQVLQDQSATSIPKLCYTVPYDRRPSTAFVVAVWELAVAHFGSAP